MTRRHFKFIPAIAAGFMAIALSACGGAGSSIEPLLAPTINNQPAAQTVAAGGTATFSVTAAGTAPLIYQWQKNSTDISGANSSTYTTPATAIGDNGAQYSVVVFNGAGTATSDKATLTVTAASGGPGAPVIGTQPANQSVVAGKTATFTVTATGSEGGGPLTYQWQKNGTDISGATSSTYTTPITVIGDSGAKYSVVVINGTGFVISNQATLSVTAAAGAPAITTQPAAQTVTEGQTATFSVTATGTAPLTYQWKKDGTSIAGATSSTYITPATSSADNAAVFTVVVSNSAGTTVTSSNATLTVTPAVEVAVAPAITTQPLTQTVAPGNTATFTVTATGTTLSYQWKKDGTDISGATSSSYDISNTTSANDGVYSVVVSNSAGTVTSSNATLTVTRYSQVANASGGFYDKTECVKDNKTGLIWEGKTASPSTSRLGTSTYSNYDGTGVGQKADGSNASALEISAASNSMGHRQSVNSSSLCGFTDWEMPSKEQLLGIVDAAYYPKINPTWFPHTRQGTYWSSSPNVSNAADAWGVNFLDGLAYINLFRSVTVDHPVRLVRCGAAVCTNN